MPGCCWVLLLPAASVLLLPAAPVLLPPVVQQVKWVTHRVPTHIRMTVLKLLLSLTITNVHCEASNLLHLLLHHPQPLAWMPLRADILAPHSSTFSEVSA
jgi:hypothetical protein